MSEYWVPENDIEQDKVKSTENVLHYVKDAQRHSEEIPIMKSRKVFEKNRKKFLFNKFIYTAAYYCQFFILSAIILFLGLKINFSEVWLLGAFFIAEIFILEESRRLGYEKISYRKGCLFACVDLFAVTIFCGFFCVYVFQLFYPIKINTVYLYPWALYTLSRKIYIYKNFTYEK